MTNREKILLGMAGAAAIAAAIYLMFQSGASRPAPTPVATASGIPGAASPAGTVNGNGAGTPAPSGAPESILAQARATLAEAVVTQGQLYVLEAATRQAAPNPFHPVPGKGEAGGSGASGTGPGGRGAAHDIAYTGYVAIGNSVLAILDGLEYRAGETVADTGYIVKSITPGKVVLASPGDVTDREIPYSGDDL